MEQIAEIFNRGQNINPENIIKPVKIDWFQHSTGIVNIARSFVPITEKNPLGFVIDAKVKETLKQFLLYFSGDEKCSFDLNKGLFVVGGVGSGKTLLFKIFKEYTKKIIRINSFRAFTSQEIVDNVNVSGIDFLNQFGTGLDYPMTCYFDDIASANENINRFGTKTNVIEQLLSMRYNVYHRHSKLTHITSNKFLSEMEQLYGDRITDRIVEMFNIIELDTESKRK